MRIGIVTISTSLMQGGREADGSGDAIAEIVTAPPLEATIAARTAVADDRAAISAILAAWADGGTCDVILTTGGTGFAPTDFTPEATNDVIERAAPGLSEAMRAGTAVHTPLAWLSRGVSGLRGQTLIINLPGRPKAVRECLAVIMPLLPHALGIFTGQIQQHERQP